MPTLTPAQIAGYAKAAGFAGTQVVIMTAIALGESGGRTDITHKNNDAHGSTDYGLWQINDYWNADILRSGDWRNPADNARMARAVFEKQGYQAWSVYKQRTYAKHLAEAQTGSINPEILPTANTGIPNPSILVNPRTWFRVAMFALGIQLILLALALMGWDAIPQSIKSTAAKVAKVAITKKVA